MFRRLLPIALVVATAAAAGAQVRRRAAPPPFSPPPAKYTPTAEEQSQLDAKQKELRERLKPLAGRKEHLADAAVFLHVAEMADRLNLYTGKNQVATVLRGLDVGLQRCDLLEKNQTPWLTQPGKSLRGYVSRVDGSIQPYMVVLPAAFDAKSQTRCDVVLHGRGPTEITFLQGALPAANYKAPDEAFIEVHPFGRANNGWRWAGETDVFEALAEARKLYRIDPNRTILRGFSMGGHGAWQIGVHYPGEWAGVSPGAGFTETKNYAHLTDVQPDEEKLLHIYDAVDYAWNLFNTPFIGYGGEDDPQLQAALNMKAAAEKEGLPFNLIVGPKTKHAYEPNSFKEIMRQLATDVRKPDAPEVKFTTWTTKYNRCKWVTIDGLEQHYYRARVDAAVAGSTVNVKTENVSLLTLEPIPGNPSAVVIDGDRISLSKPSVKLAHNGKRWVIAGPEKGRHKRHNLQGPIDDAFMERFVAVRGKGTPWSADTQKWAENALLQFQFDWRYGFRGELPVIDDTAATEKDWSDSNLVLFGDPGSNKILARILPDLPIKWTKTGVQVGRKTYAAGHVPVLIYPNPLNPKRYVVINSGHTFTRADLDASNANLYPKLSDWAVLKLGSPTPEVAAQGFFDETWKLK